MWNLDFQSCLRVQGSVLNMRKNIIYDASRLTPGSKQLDVKSWFPVWPKSTEKCAQHTQNTIYYACRLTPDSKQLNVKSWLPVLPKSTGKCAQHAKNIIYDASRLTPGSKQPESWLQHCSRVWEVCSTYVKYNILSTWVGSWQEASRGEMLTSGIAQEYEKCAQVM